MTSSDKFSFLLSDVENIKEKQITPEEIKKVIAKFAKHTENFIKNFKKSFGVDLGIKYGAIFYES